MSKKNLSLGKLAYSTGINTDTASQTSLDDCGDNRSLLGVNTAIGEFWAEISGSYTEPDTITLENNNPQKTVMVKFNPLTSGSLSSKVLSTTQSFDWNVTSNLNELVDTVFYGNFGDGIKIEWRAITASADIDGTGDLCFLDYFITNVETIIQTDILFRVSSL